MDFEDFIGATDATVTFRGCLLRFSVVALQSPPTEGYVPQAYEKFGREGWSRYRRVAWTPSLCRSGQR